MDENDEKVRETNTAMVRAIATTISDVLNLSVFFSTIDQVILSNLQLWWKWYSNNSNNKTDKIDEKFVETQVWITIW